MIGWVVPRFPTTKSSSIIPLADSKSISTEPSWPPSLLSTYSTNAVRRPYLSIQIDGETDPWKATVVALTASPQTVMLAEGLALGHHVVRVFKRSESSQSATALNEIQTDGYFVEAPDNERLKIEFIGDSLTCGFGNLGTSGSEPFRTETEDGLLSYASLTSRMLDADYHIVAVSGIGMNISPYASVNMATVYPKTDIGKSTPWTFSAFVPDVIVLNLGANDNIYVNSLPIAQRAAAIEAFYQAYLAFTIALRERHPDAWIVLVVIPSWLNHLRGSIEAVASHLTDQGDALITVSVVNSGLPTDGMGSSFHPTYKTHIRQAEDLTITLEQILGIVRVRSNIPIKVKKPESDRHSLGMPTRDSGFLFALKGLNQRLKFAHFCRNGDFLRT
ncbi:MAG: GDSL-type esterase/lipase family protein [Bacillus subtilis]|nr:GDSL-type esterase/lipase family protein [Bacillus subtilis]